MKLRFPFFLAARTKRAALSANTGPAISAADLEREFGREKWRRIYPMLKHFAEETLAIDQEAARKVKAAGEEQKRKRDVVLRETTNRIRILQLTEAQQKIVDAFINKTR